MRPNQTGLILKSFNQLCKKLHLTNENNWYISADKNAIVLSYVGDDKTRFAFWFVKESLKLIVDGYFINPNDLFYREIYMLEKDDIDFLKKNLLVF